MPNDVPGSFSNRGVIVVYSEITSRCRDETKSFDKRDLPNALFYQKKFDKKIKFRMATIVRRS